MQNRVYGPSGLIALLGLLALVVGLVVLVVLPGLRFVAWVVLTLGILLLATALIVEFRQVGRVLTGRRARFGAGSTLMASVFIGITLLANAISIKNYQRFDLTGLAQFTLTPQTKEALSKLETPVQVLLFFTPEDPLGITGYATTLLTEYQNHTDKLSVKTIDPDEHPDAARQYGITQYQTVVFESQNRLRLVFPQEIGEQAEYAFTSAILEVTGTTQRKVYFLSGHGEGDIDSQASDGYSRAKLGLLDNLFQIEKLDLIVTPEIPKDCAALIIAAPQASLISSELEMIKNYLKSGGGVLILLNPNPPAEIKQLLSSWGAGIEGGTVIDPSSYVTGSLETPLVPKARNLLSLPELYFPGATAIIPQETAGIEMMALVWTSKESWLEKDFDPLKKPEFNEGRDMKGPLALATIIATQAPAKDSQKKPEILPQAEAKPEETKVPQLVVIGDSDFASNEHFFNGNNSDLFLNSVNLLTAGTELISMERKILPFRRLLAGPEATRFINYSSISLLPLLVLITGGIIWWRRR